MFRGEQQMKVKMDKDEVELDFIPVFVIGFDEEFERGVIMLMPAHELMAEVEEDFQVYAIDAAIDMLMQRRDKLEKRELH